MENITIKMKHIKTTKNHKYLYLNINKIYNIYNIILCLIFISLSLSIQKVNLNKIDQLNSDSDIILTIKGNNQQQILYTGYNQKPYEILLNGNKTNNADYYYVYDLI